MRAWFAALALLFVAWLCGCATWPDEDSFDRLVSAFADVKRDAASGDPEAEEFWATMTHPVWGGRIIKGLDKLPGHYTAAELQCINRATRGSLWVPKSPDNTVTVNDIIDCATWMTPPPGIDGPIGIFMACVNYLVDGDHRVDKVTKYYADKGVNALCEYVMADRVSRAVDWDDTTEFSAEEVAVTFLGMQEVPNSGWNWAWINVNILAGFDEAFPGCTLCKGAPVGGDK